MEVYRFQKYVPMTEQLKQWNKEDLELFLSSLEENDPLRDYLKEDNVEPEYNLIVKRNWDLAIQHKITIPQAKALRGYLEGATNRFATTSAQAEAIDNMITLLNDLIELDERSKK